MYREVETRTGHTTLYDDDGYRYAHVIDLGDHCAIDSVNSAHTTRQAREVGAALIQWACRKDAGHREEIRIAQGRPEGAIVRDVLP